MIYLLLLSCYISISLVHSPFFCCFSTHLFLSVQPDSLWVTLTVIYISLQLSFSHPTAGSSHNSFSTHLHLPLLSQAASSALLSSYTIISSSCTCSIEHCSEVELELCKEKTDYLLSCKITTRLFPVCWPGLCLGDKQHCLLIFSLPRIPSTLSWLFHTEWIINHFYPLWGFLQWR